MPAPARINLDLNFRTTWMERIVIETESSLECKILIETSINEKFHLEETLSLHRYQLNALTQTRPTV
jgi:hypothetical protein